MNAELLYTSAPEGLKRGSRGFCTVVATEGLPVNVSQRLESLSGYRHVFQPGEDRDADNPVCHSHVRFTVGGRLLHVVSRIAAYGVDYSQRTNKLAHHIVVDRPPPGGPVPLLQSGAFLHSWDGVCRTKSQGPSLQGSAIAASICHRWETVTGDAGWGGLLAAAWASSASKPLWIVFELSQSKELLALIGESIALLPESTRWDATFSTYCTNLPPDVECRVRCVLSGSDEARMAAARGTVIHLGKKQGEPPKSSWVEAARTGHYPSPSAAVPTIDSRELHDGDAQSKSSALLGAPSDPPADDQLEYELMGVPSASPPPTIARARSRIRPHSVELDDLPPPVRRSKRWLVASIAVALFALLGSCAALFYWQYQNNQRIADALELAEEIPEDKSPEVEGVSNANDTEPRKVDPSIYTESGEASEEPTITSEGMPSAPVSRPDPTSQTPSETGIKALKPDKRKAILQFRSLTLPWMPTEKCVFINTEIKVVLGDDSSISDRLHDWIIKNDRAELKKTAKSYTVPSDFASSKITLSLNEQSEYEPPSAEILYVLPNITAIIDLQNSNTENLSDCRLEVKWGPEFIGSNALLKTTTGDKKIFNAQNEYQVLVAKDFIKDLDSEESKKQFINLVRKRNSYKETLLGIESDVSSTQAIISSHRKSIPDANFLIPVPAKGVDSPEKLEAIWVQFTQLEDLSIELKKEIDPDAFARLQKLIEEIKSNQNLFISKDRQSTSGASPFVEGNILLHIWENGLRTHLSNMKRRFEKRDEDLDDLVDAFRVVANRLFSVTPKSVTIAFEHTPESAGGVPIQKPRLEMEFPFDLVVKLGERDSRSLD